MITEAAPTTEELCRITGISPVEAGQIESQTADGIHDLTQLFEEPTVYTLVDSIPEVAAERRVVRDHAEHILETNRARAKADKSLELIPVDALSTGRSVLAAERTYGVDSPERREHWSGLVLDCQRLVGEWYRKLKPEYFEPVRHIFNEKEQAFYSHGLSIRQMTENALVPITEDPEEERRRVNEHVEDRTPQIMQSLGALAVGDTVRTISETTESARNSYAEDMKYGRKHRGYRGYVPEIDKYMVRDVWIDPGSGDRFVEQLALPGVYHTHEIVQMALERRGVDASDMDRTGLHSAQFIARDGLMCFAELADKVAREQWCNENIFMGEEVEPDHKKDYSKFREEALQRQESLKDLAETTAVFILDVAADPEFDSRKGPAHVEEFVKMLLLDLGKHDKEVAAQMFDEKTANGLQEVARLEAAGEHEAAHRRMQQVKDEAPGGGSCGAGSCGLEDVDLSGEEGKELKQKLGVQAGDKVVRDKERACPNCHKKSIVYAYNSSKVKKYCETCQLKK